MNRRLTKLPLFVCLVAATACGGGGPEELEIDQTEQGITGGYAMPSYHPLTRTAVTLGNCTAIVVAKRKLITAAHCNPMVGNGVAFFEENVPSGWGAWIDRVDMRSGVNPATDDYIDSTGKFADIAVITLDRDVAPFSVKAELPGDFPGNNVRGVMVGRGNHNGQPNSTGQLRYIWTNTYSTHVNDGHFLTEGSNVDNGDSGGGFFTYNASSRNWEVHGTLYGRVWEWAYRGKYTSIEHHLDWVLDKTDYGTSQPWQFGRYVIGTYLGYTNVGSVEREAKCILSCEKDGRCEGVTMYGSYCYKYENVTGTGTNSALRAVVF